jgi:hypothetical protein
MLNLETMTQIATYFDLLFNIEMSDQKLIWLDEDPKYKKDLIAENETNRLLKKEFDFLHASLLEDNSDADKIRIGYIHTSNSLLNKLSKIENLGGYFPDLNQGMVISGYLFGLILNDYRTNLTSEGNYCPVAHIYMSKQKWPAIDLKKLLLEISQDLLSIRFNCKMDAINFYEGIRRGFYRLIENLREFLIL